MKRLLFFAVVALISMTASAKSEFQVKDYPVSDFTQLVINGPLRVELTQSNSNNVSVESDAIDKIDVQCLGGVLMLSVNTKGTDSYNVFKAKISVKILDKITVTKGAVLNVADDFRATDIAVSAKSASTVYFRPQCSSLHVSAGNASKVVLTGTADNFILRCTDASDCQAQFMKTKNAEVYCSDASQAVINTDTLSAEAHSASKVSYIGNPIITRQETSFASTIVAQ